eukprot:CAMPEP_0172313214 /NCGR_PEP_ID=MMETSP1058-20130122/19702_1 /TAXON_ID=83371 /ORGANISM="Detonula confervacea, Strain CCMP 353" /LENGTH=96 /DNA_ID=CAMNT_0013026829 /DNA_START=558 /DNA_END=848 /DNA_ORIENTATION=-
MQSSSWMEAAMSVSMPMPLSMGLTIHGHGIKAIMAHPPCAFCFFLFNDATAVDAFRAVVPFPFPMAAANWQLSLSTLHIGKNRRRIVDGGGGERGY